MGGSNQPSKWWMPKDSNFGVPQPQYVIPAAYINKQAAEWPQGKYLPPCIIPPPVMTVVGNTLIVGGASVALPLLSIPQRCEFAPVAPASPGDVSGTALATVTGINNGVFIQLNCAFQNSGPDEVTSAVVKLQNIVRIGVPYGIPSGHVVITVGPTIITGTFYEATNGIIVPSIPAGATVNIEIQAQTQNKKDNHSYVYIASCAIGIRGGPSAVEFNLANNDTAFTYDVSVEP
jgi:hypothetical protein